MAGFDCKPAAKCHSISEGRILRRLAEDGKVIGIAPSDISGTLTLDRVGISQVSTFSGFCAKHDQELFSPIDNFDYRPEDRKQEYLFAYRTIARYHYYKLAWRYAQEAKLSAYQQALKSGKRLYSTGLDRHLTDTEASKLIQLHESATAEAVHTSTSLRDLMGKLNTGIGRQEYKDISTRIIELPDEYPIAQSGSLIVDGDTATGLPHMITVNVLPQVGRTYALLSCTGVHGTYCIDVHLEQFRIAGQVDYRHALTHVICMAGDPIAIKPSYWEALPATLRSSFIERLNLWSKGGVDPVRPGGSFNILRV